MPSPWDRKVALQTVEGAVNLGGNVKEKKGRSERRLTYSLRGWEKQPGRRWERGEALFPYPGLTLEIRELLFLRIKVKVWENRLK